MDKLVTRLKEGDTSIREEIINKHIGIAISTAYKYGGNTDKAELISSAMFALCQAVEWAPTRLEDNNITPYIIACVRRFVFEHINANNLVRVPYCAYKKGYKKYIPTYDIYVDKDDENITIDKVVYDDTPPCEIESILNSLHLTKRGKLIVTMRADGYTLAEIAEKTNISEQRVHQILFDIRQKAEVLL